MANLNTVEGVIYCYTNTVNDKCYIGQTVNEASRKYKHCWDALKKNSPNVFHRAIRKYGIEVFNYEVIAVNLNSTSIAGSSLNISVEWTESTF